MPLPRAYDRSVFGYLRCLNKKRHIKTIKKKKKQTMKHLYQVRYQTRNKKHKSCHNVVADSPSEATRKVKQNMENGTAERDIFEWCEEEKTLQVITIARVDIY